MCIHSFNVPSKCVLTSIHGCFLIVKKPQRDSLSTPMSQDDDTVLLCCQTSYRSVSVCTFSKQQIERTPPSSVFYFGISGARWSEFEFTQPAERRGWVAVVWNIGSLQSGGARCLAERGSKWSEEHVDSLSCPLLWSAELCCLTKRIKPR